MQSYLVGFFVFFHVLHGLSVGKAEFIHEPGYCMWYGQCGTNPATLKPVNCLYNGLAKPVDGSQSFDILAKLCPEFSHSYSRVCCSYKQLVSLQSGLQSAEQLMSGCPSCWRNFRELYCRLTCSPNNSMFIEPTELSADKKAILSINYYVEKAYRDGLYSSCKDVTYPFTKQKIMDFLCGTTVDNCSPLKFLNFMGDPQLNGVSPFTINYPSVSPEPPMKAMNITVIPCNKPVPSLLKKTMEEACACQDCIPSCKTPQPITLEYLATKVIFALKPTSNLNKWTCYKNFFQANCAITGTILRLGILQKVLKVQIDLMNITAQSGSETTSFADFCVKSSSGNCWVISALQYWQNDEKKLNKCIPALPGIPCSPPNLFSASWGDHLQKCANDPLLTNDTTKLGLSCISLYGEPVKPTDVLGGYEKENITDASLLFVTFAIKKHLSNAEIEKARAWFEKFVEYVKNFDDKDLQLAYTPIDLLESDMKL